MLSLASHLARSSIRRTPKNVSSLNNSRSLPTASILKQRRWFQSSPQLFQSSAAVPQSVPLSRLSENFIDGTSANYVEQMYQAWSKDKSSVHASWAAYFSNMERGAAPGQAHAVPPSVSAKSDVLLPTTGSADQRTILQVTQKATESMRLLNLVNAYQVYGHHASKLDPLQQSPVEVPPQLLYTTYGFTEADLDREFYLGQEHTSGFLGKERPVAKLRDIITRLEDTYCSTIGVEYMHIQDAEAINWIREKFETPTPYSFTTEERTVIFDRLAWATKFERFIGLKYGTTKRFGVDGCETLIPGLKALVDVSSDLGVEHVVFGMPHRGRLNVLANVVRKPTEAIFHEFAGATAAEDDFYTGSGDVKYHLGTSYRRPTRGGKFIHLTLLANPSHLEAVNPVVEGKARATQYFLKDWKHEKVMSMQLHGDAAFAGQGVVYETLGLSSLPNYTTGGTVHIIVNNQVGFTTDPSSARGTRYCTDVAKAAGVPVFHVNADDPEAVVHVCQIAAQWRQRFHKDVVIDLIGYRRFGHNEGDEPRFTQPQMYKKIDEQKPSFELYAEYLQHEKVITAEKLKEIENGVQAGLDKAFAASVGYKPKKDDWLSSVWKGFHDTKAVKPQPTATTAEVVKRIGETVSAAPASFKVHPTLQKTLQLRKAAVDSGAHLDWSMGEAIAFGSLLLEGTHVRLSGQDVERGTFSHRHAVIHDQNSNLTYVPLNNLAEKQETLTVTNSSLSEFGVLGFELGYSLTNPNALVLWEAQFGDFSNGAQIIIDQFISSGEAKWKRQTGLVMLLPHGYDGMGPEHSSARLERYLALCDADPDVIPQPTDNDERVIQRSNMQVVNCTTPANYFHVLRRQVHRAFRKPLIVMSPKNLLRHKTAVSTTKEFIGDTTFQTVIPDATADPAKVDRLLFCSGKVYYDLLEKRTKENLDNAAIVRIEQLHPFPFAKVQAELKKFAKAQVFWVQEEPKNMGPCSFVMPHLRTAGKETRGANFVPTYAGRAAAASPATGYSDEHKRQIESFMKVAFGK
eukprot:TRINITY_DN1256_c0_g1_i1.p1 TRINITY_DN1256_c0_g1~~TRINITY_DN1256_c0_g1_i1.p1  ORF type:complete len:1024 (+),score=305.35 TRINITY_DN1256_c0_g1_i1:177-3248(+)